MITPTYIHGVVYTRPVSVQVTKTTLDQFEMLQQKLSLTGDQVLELADDLNIEAFKDEISLSGAFQALERGHRGIGNGKYGRKA